MLIRNKPFGTIGGQHEFGAAFEQYGKLFDANGFEIDTKTGERLEGPESKNAPKVQHPTQKQTAPPAQENDLQAAIASAGSVDEAIAALLRLKGQEPKKVNAPPVGLSMQSVTNPRPEPQEQQSGQQQVDPQAGPNDIVRGGVNLSAWARGDLADVDFKRVQPLVAEAFGKKPVNATLAIKIINAGLPQE